MPISFTCPHCGLAMNVADQYAGQSGPCSQCGKPITIPGTPGAAGTPFYPPPKPASKTPIWIIVLAVAVPMVLVCGGILLALLLPAVSAAREAARRAQCSNNLKQIGLALLNYESTFGALPPAVFADDHGKPMKSWRVAILPFLDQEPLYQQYDSKQPWDSPQNRALGNTPLSIFRCPSDPGAVNFGGNQLREGRRQGHDRRDAERSGQARRHHGRSVQHDHGGGSLRPTHQLGGAPRRYGRRVHGHGFQGTSKPSFRRLPGADGRRLGAFHQQQRRPQDATSAAVAQHGRAEGAAGLNSKFGNGKGRRVGQGRLGGRRPTNIWQNWWARARSRELVPPYNRWRIVSAKRKRGCLWDCPSLTLRVSMVRLRRLHRGT